jgi:hypothetical protein
MYWIWSELWVNWRNENWVGSGGDEMKDIYCFSLIEVEV